jgi:hypothetical protein
MAASGDFSGRLRGDSHGRGQSGKLASSVSAKPREPLYYKSFPQVVSDRRCRRETLS